MNGQKLTRKWTDEGYFDYVRRRKKDIRQGKNQIVIYSGGRNMGKTTKVFRVELYDEISKWKQFKNPDIISPIGIIFRTEKGWDKVKADFLSNLNLPILVEGTKIYYVENETLVKKDKTIITKLKRRFMIAQIFILWNANDYKKGNYERYKCLIFDEIIPEFEGYIPKEFVKFLSLVTTFFRLKDNKYVVGISNNVSDYSPYYEEYGMSPDEYPNAGELYKTHNNDTRVLIENVQQSKLVKAMIAKSTAGKLNKDSDYGKMSLGAVLKSEKALILSSPKDHYYALYNVWIDNVSYVVNHYSSTAFWITIGNDKSKKNYYLDSYSALLNGAPFTNVDGIINQFSARAQKGRLWCANTEIKENILLFLERFY